MDGGRKLLIIYFDGGLKTAVKDKVCSPVRFGPERVQLPLAPHWVGQCNKAGAFLSMNGSHGCGNLLGG